MAPRLSHIPCDELREILIEVANKYLEVEARTLQNAERVAKHNDRREDLWEERWHTHRYCSNAGPLSNFVREVYKPRFDFLNQVELRILEAILRTGHKHRVCSRRLEIVEHKLETYLQEWMSRHGHYDDYCHHG